jgi:hypothetical protein
MLRLRSTIFLYTLGWVSALAVLITGAWILHSASYVSALRASPLDTSLGVPSYTPQAKFVVSGFLATRPLEAATSVRVDSCEKPITVDMYIGPLELDRTSVAANAQGASDPFLHGFGRLVAKARIMGFISNGYADATAITGNEFVGADDRRIDDVRLVMEGTARAVGRLSVSRIHGTMADSLPHFGAGITPDFPWFWGDHLHIHFRAAWLSKRSYGTCYLRLPEVVGFSPALAVLTAATDLDSTFHRAFWVDRSATTVVGNGSVDPGLSQPPPNGGSGRWTCDETPKDASSPCTAVAVFSERNASGRATERITIGGILLGTGVVWLVAAMARGFSRVRSSRTQPQPAKPRHRKGKSRPMSRRNKRRT